MIPFLPDGPNESVETKTQISHEPVLGEKDFQLEMRSIALAGRTKEMLVN